ncbi:dienelactone hydrolase [Natronobacillus azotifigens]|uniref:Alpha/beta hydrolase n=1 Tax=Natronobacillus azotifigens TaxID=472978 RepID=A0A9J6RC50_9BACI|nr:hypothetical protein [Natronobacillus azotifigens]MCZ0703119.1 hypothetical protein [Natronobacillus azotifigens]
MKQFFKKPWSWTAQRLVANSEKDRTYTICCMVVFLLVTTSASIMVALGTPTGATSYTNLLDIGRAVAINGLLFFITTILVGVLLSFLPFSTPRLLLGGLIYSIGIIITVLIYDKSGKLFSFLVGIGVGLISLFIGLLFAMLFYRNKRRIVVFLILPIILVITIFIRIHDNEGNRSLDQSELVFADYTESILGENPGQEGDYSYTFFTYGSGEDKHRAEFGRDVTVQTPTVDASDFVTRWGNKREAFWGFDQTNLPVNGRTWVPEGVGPFPLILLVHGNHIMEHFSTGGYDYLGELLASRGFLTISVDQDFINFSNVSGIPDHNYKLRAWVLLQHLVQLQELNETPGNEFFQKIDFDRVGLVGHSRGGQAVSMVADHQRFFKNVRLREELATINIEGVVALAPTDRRVDGKKANLNNVSYLVIQGARDADVNDFRGDHQFYRTNFSKDDQGFKASLYIADANHSQFNSEWGRMDNSLPRGIFLNRKQTMDPEDQRRIAKVYLSAFFESVLHNREGYEQLFPDHQYGKDWLPETTFISKYQNSSYVPITEAKHASGEVFGGSEAFVETSGFREVEILRPEQRTGNNRPVDAVLLEWKGDATYTINLAEGFESELGLEKPEHLVVTMANVAEDGSVPAVEIELESVDGGGGVRSLEEIMPIPPVIETEFTHFGLFDTIFREGKYENSWEPVFQTFMIPIDSFFEPSRGELDLAQINKIKLHFRSESGKMLLEEVGACHRPNYVERGELSISKR